ncbi:MAG: AAA family ATPase [Pikeienuella sp.]
MNEQSSAASLEKRVEHTPPAWFEEISTGLSIRGHFLITGNTADLYPVVTKRGLRFVSFEAAVWRALEGRGYVALLVHDPSNGLVLHPDCDPRLSGVLEECGLPLGETAATPEDMTALLGAVMGEKRLPIALMLRYASGLLQRPAPALDRMLVSVDLASRGPELAREGIDWECPGRNPVFWMLQRPGDLPEWFSGQNATVRELVIGLPDLTDRTAFAAQIVDELPQPQTLSEADRKSHVSQFAIKCEGMPLSEMKGVVDLAKSARFGPERLIDALRSYRIGTTRNPWTSAVMRERVRAAEKLLSGRVLGQKRAVEKTYDILVRSIMGLSGAQTSSRGNRPRGVLFFVGPTGVGKTELAKALTEVLFGDEAAMQRYDMSEFVNEESIGRLIGAPAGAPGHEEGGELVNKVRARPFSVFLFDEVEKGHPRILDAFLQILDDGRLTDTRGETGYFSESLIIFTSNVGIVGGDRSTNMGQNILPSDAHEVLEEKLTQAVGNHFRYELRRPELMNRMGQNIVAFEFIHPKSAEIIFRGILKRVLKAVTEEHSVVVELTKDAEAELLEMCTSELGDGGRGIGNRIETHFINPIARLLFRREGIDRLRITAVRHEGRETVLYTG